MTDVERGCTEGYLQPSEYQGLIGRLRTIDNNISDGSWRGNAASMRATEARGLIGLLNPNENPDGPNSGYILGLQQRLSGY